VLGGGGHSRPGPMPCSSSTSFCVRLSVLSNSSCRPSKVPVPASSPSRLIVERREGRGGGEGSARVGKRRAVRPRQHGATTEGLLRGWCVVCAGCLWCELESWELESGVVDGRHAANCSCCAGSCCDASMARQIESGQDRDPSNERTADENLERLRNSPPDRGCRGCSRSNVFKDSRPG
jgi:hypothetical protein